MGSMNLQALHSFGTELAKTSASIGIRKLIKTVGRYADTPNGKERIMVSSLGDATVGTTQIRNKGFGVGSGNQVSMLKVNPHFRRMGVAPKMLGDSAKQMKDGRLWGDYHFSDGGRAAANSAIKRDSLRRAQGKSGITFKQGEPMSKRNNHVHSLWGMKNREAHYYKQIPESGPRPKTDLFDPGGSAVRLRNRGEARKIIGAENRRPSPESIRQAIKDSGIKRKPMPKPRASKPFSLDPNLGKMDAAHTPKRQGIIGSLINDLKESHRRKTFAAAEKSRAEAAAKKWPKITEDQKTARQARLERLREKYYQQHKKWVGKPPSVLERERQYRQSWG